MTSSLIASAMLRDPLYHIECLTAPSYTKYLISSLSVRCGYSETPEELYRKALSIAEEQEAKLWELRAATSLARLWVNRAAAPKHVISSPRSTAGSPRASIPPISKRRRRCWTS